VSEERLTIRLPLGVRHRLTTLADEQGTTVSALVRRAAEALAEGAEVSVQTPLSDRELATIRRLDGWIVEAVEKHPRARRRWLYARLRSNLRTRELQATLEPTL
jgi:hypothetical protein